MKRDLHITVTDRGGLYDERRVDSIDAACAFVFATKRQHPEKSIHVDDLDRCDHCEDLGWFDGLSDDERERIWIAEADGKEAAKGEAA